VGIISRVAVVEGCVPSNPEDRHLYDLVAQMGCARRFQPLRSVLTEICTYVSLFLPRHIEGGNAWTGGCR
jgi:hypothetical protein